MEAAVYSGVSAGLAGVLTEVIFYGLDSYKVFSQAGGEVKMSRLFRGALPIALLGSGPSFGVFFLCYNPLRNFMSAKLGPGSGQESASVLFASVVSCVPSSIVAVPADVVKKRMLLGTPSGSSGHFTSSVSVSVRSVVLDIVRNGGIHSLFLGWQANLLKDIPFCGIKMSLYEGFARMYLRYKHTHSSMNSINIKTNMITEGIPNNTNNPNNPNSLHSEDIATSKLSGDHLSRVESAGIGLMSGLATAILTCPIDCVNTRIKSGELAEFSIVGAHMEIIRRDGTKALFRGLVPRSLILGLGSTLFWYLEAMFRHAMKN